MSTQALKRKDDPAAAGAGRKAKQGAKASAQVEELVPRLGKLTWKARLADLVGPAQAKGLPIHTALGELIPGAGLDMNNQAPSRLTGQPDWHVFLDARGGHPSARFMNLALRPRHVAKGPEWGGLGTDQDESLAIPLSLPLGEDLSVPANQRDLAKQLQQEFFGKTWFVIALGRARSHQARGARGQQDPVIMEIYDPKTEELVWRNPFGKTLERAIEEILGLELAPAPRAALTGASPDVVEKAEPIVRNGPSGTKPQASPGRQESLQAQYKEFAGRGLDEDSVVELIARTEALSLSLVRQGYRSFLKKNPDLAEGHRERLAAIERLLIEARICGLEDDDLWAGIQDSTEGTPLQGMTMAQLRNLAEPPIPKPKPSLTEASGRIVPFSETSSAGVRTKHVARQSLEGIPEGSAAWWVEQLRSDEATFRSRVLLFLRQTPTGTAAPGEIRAFLGIPMGCTNEWKAVSDCFRRTILRKLYNDGHIKMNSEKTRNTTYRLA